MKFHPWKQEVKEANLAEHSPLPTECVWAHC